MPERDIRDLRQFTCYQRAVIRDISAEKNRIEKLFQSSGFRLSSFLTDISGSSDLEIMRQLVQVGSISSQSLEHCLKDRACQEASDILSSG